MIRIAICLLLLAFASVAAAHKPSDSYLTLQVRAGERGIAGQWDIALRDLDLALDLDRDRDGAITWGELRTRRGDVFGYALSRLGLTAAGQPCALTARDLLVDGHSDGGYAVLRFDAACTAPAQQLDVAYRLLFDVDPSHRGLLRVDADGASRSFVLSPERPLQPIDLAQTSRLATFAQFVGDGVHHIWIGYDHMLFLVSLLLPAVLLRREQTWQPVVSLRSALMSVLGVVTAFTVSHSITLTLAALDVISLPSRLVESGIALSVLLAALNNIRPLVTRRGWLLAFCFGLVHGFGFASVLNDLGLPRAALALALAGFNVGVEIGQLVLVLLLVPIVYLMRDTRLYPRFVMTAASAVIALFAGGWLIERSLDLRLMPF